MVPVFVALFLIVRGAPTLARSTAASSARRERGALALMAAAALPLVVAITEIATEHGTIDEADAVALVGAAMLSLLVPGDRDRARAIYAGSLTVWTGTS